MANDLPANIERVLATLTRFFADEGKAREVALLSLSRHRIEQTSLQVCGKGDALRAGKACVT